MTDVLSVLSEHHRRLAGSFVEIEEIPDPETGTPLRVYYDPPTQAQMAKVQSRAKGRESDLVFYTVLLLAKDAEGKPMFEDNAQTQLTLREHVSGAILGKIGKAILGLTAEDDLGN
ncbi:tail assembly chaperone [Dinoroseobacter phage vB_DshS-R4C]|nr:tail assembly chaperone [Dinoroseobacter phage vB_DshS-R4C]